MRGIVVICVLAFFIQCRSVEKEPLFVKNIKVKENVATKKYDAFYIVPPTICAGCNSHAMRMAYLILEKEYRAKVFFECFPENFEIMVTKLKEERVFGKDNYSIDTMLFYNKIDSVTVVNSPAVVYLKEGAVQSYEILSPNTPNVVTDLIKKVSNEKK